MASVLILNAQIVNEGTISERDIFIRDGFIEKIASDLAHLSADDIIDATGLFLLPGMIDDQVHFREPGLTHKGDIATESRAAIAGGITSYMEMPNVNPATTNMAELEKKFALAAQKSRANYSFYLGATNHNLEDIKSLDKNRVCGVKVFMGASTGNLLVDDPRALENIFQHAPTLIATHCEDSAIICANENLYRRSFGENIPIEYHPIIRSEKACFTSSAYAVELAKKFHSDLHVLHISTAKELVLFAAGDIGSKKITAEACAHFLWFNSEDYNALSTLIKCNPAIKHRSDQLSLIDAINNDVIDIIATDHAPHTLSEKYKTYFNALSGLPLVQHALISLLDKVKQGIFTLEKIVEKTSHNPALRYSIDRRGFIREGFYADLVLVDMNNPTLVEKNSLHYKCRWSPFEGVRFATSIHTTFVNGVKVYSQQKIYDDNNHAMELYFNRS